MGRSALGRVVWLLKMYSQGPGLVRGVRASLAFAVAGRDRALLVDFASMALVREAFAFSALVCLICPETVWGVRERLRGGASEPTAFGVGLIKTLFTCAVFCRQVYNNNFPLQRTHRRRTESRRWGTRTEAPKRPGRGEESAPGTRATTGCALRLRTAYSSSLTRSESILRVRTEKC